MIITPGHDVKSPPMAGLQFESSAVFGKLEYPLPIIIIRSTRAQSVDA